MKRREAASAVVLALVVSWGSPPPLRAQKPATGPTTVAVSGGFLIDGFGGPPVQDAVVLIEGDRIAAVGQEGRLAIPPGARVVDANGYTVMPGLIDAHVHLDILGHGDYPTWHDMVRANYADVMERSAAQLLAHGVTTIASATVDRARGITGPSPGRRAEQFASVAGRCPSSRPTISRLAQTREATRELTGAGGTAEARSSQ